MKLLLNTWCAHPDYRDRRYGYVDLTPELALLILERAQLFAKAHRQNHDLYCMKFWDCGVNYFGRLPDSVSDRARKILEDDQIGFVETLEAIEGKGLEDIDNSAMDITANSVAWSAILEAGDIEIGTREVGLDKIREIAGVDRKTPPVRSTISVG